MTPPGANLGPPCVRASTTRGGASPGGERRMCPDPCGSRPRPPGPRTAPVHAPEGPIDLELTVLEKRAECLIGHAGPLSVCIWRGSPTVPGLRALERQSVTLIERHGRISALTVVRPHRQVAQKDPEVQALEVEIASAIGARYLGLAVVIEGTGVGAAIAHGARARLLPHLGTPSEAFARVSEALHWIARLPGQDPTLYAASALSADLELLGRGDSDA